MVAISKPVRVLAPLAAAIAAYPLLPSGLTRDLGYQAISLVAVIVAVWGLVRQGPARPRGWLLVLGGYLGWFIGDSVHTLGSHFVDIDAYPGPADAAFVASAGLVACGLLLMVRRRGERTDRTAVLDVAILAAGLAVVAGVVLIAPIARDSSLTTAGKVTSSAYPMADLLLLSLLVLLWTKPGARTAAFRLLSAALMLTLLGDVLHEYAKVDSTVGSPVAEEMLWLAGYALAAGGAWTWSAPELAEPVPGAVEPIATRRRVLVLTIGLMLPALTLLGDGLTSEAPVWPVVAGGSLLMSLLVVTRMGGMVTGGQAQAVKLAGLARADQLTGIPNRRTWDFELARACEAARKLNAPLTVALIDLDNFKRYNEGRGHPAGDRLLREATAAWSELLKPGQVLARYAGQQFALLCPGLWATDVRPLVDAMRAGTPGGQTASVGIATWDPTTEPSGVVETAARALHESKRRGRDQVQLAPRPTNTTLIPRPTMLWQPIVDLRTTRPVGVEALSRFLGEDPLTVFEAATSVGSGPTLEATAITYALTNRPKGLWVSVNVSLEALGSVQVQRALAGNLTDVVLEVTEHSGTDVSALAPLLQELRARGALIAVDDWGPGLSNIDRLVLLKPDIVKLDISRVTTLSADHQSATISLIVEWAELVGARICAEGVETEEQWQQLRGLGVQLAQGYFFGRPMLPEELLTLPRDSVLVRPAS